MNIQPHILNAGGRLIPFENIIETTSKQSIEHVCEFIPIDNVDIIFYDSYLKGIIPHYGFGGYSITPNLIMIPINPEFNQLEKSFEDNLPRIIAHELYHCIRNYTYTKKHTLLEAFVNEGLADLFDMEVNKKPPEKWDVVLNEKEILKLIERAKKEYDNKNYDRKVWFFESKKENIPHWSGYAIGFYLVNQYFKNHPDQKPSNLYKKEVKFFI